MIDKIEPIFYANRLKETKKVFVSSGFHKFFEIGKSNSSIKACYAYFLCKHFGIESPEINRVEKEGKETFCQRIYEDWEEFDFTSSFTFSSKKRLNKLQNKPRLIRSALFDEQFMVFRKKDLGYNLALIYENKLQIVSRDYFQCLDSNYRKSDSIKNSIFFKNIIRSISLDECLLEIENYFGLQDKLIEEKLLLLSAYLKEDKYKELFLHYLQNESRNEEIRSKMIKQVYLLKR